jgi:hypothetical protein
MGVLEGLLLGTYLQGGGTGSALHDPPFPLPPPKGGAYTCIKGLLDSPYGFLLLLVFL